MNPLDLIQTARELTSKQRKKRGGHRVREANLRRAVSTAYYALFHTLAQNCADTLIGGLGADRHEAAWRQVYRLLEHGLAKDACRNTKLIARFPQGIQHFATHFVLLQEKRHAADYDPSAVFLKSDVIEAIDASEAVISSFNEVALKDRRAFAAHVLFKTRRE